MLLYVHIPFCRKKCSYCAFTSFEGQESQAEKYIGFLLKEARDRKNEYTEPVETLFIGGGTPSLLPPETISYLSNALFDIIPDGRDRLKEFTIESNPGTVTEKWISAAAAAGMNRLSLGMQAFQPDLLQILGRIHTYEDVERTVLLARSSGIGNINIDLIFGIPGQTLQQWRETLDAALSLKPDHISAYGLIPEENTPLHDELESGKLILPDPDLERSMYDTAISVLRRHGLMQYEVSNFARPGFECRHNIGYWKQIPYAGLGVSAASMQILRKGKSGMVCTRRTNPGNIPDYQKMVTENLPPAENEYVTAAETRFETLMLGLRMNEGIDEDQFEMMHGVTVEETFGEKLRQFEANDLMIHSGRKWKLTRRGFDIQNSILVELMYD